MYGVLLCISAFLFHDVKIKYKGFKIFLVLGSWLGSYDKYIPRSNVKFLTTSFNPCYKDIKYLTFFIVSMHIHILTERHTNSTI